MNFNTVTFVTDHTAFIALAIAVCAVALIFGALHIIAAGVQMSKDHKRSHIMMITGGALCVLAAVACLCGFGGSWNLDALLMAVGGGAVCGAAWYNGKSGGNFHLAHHITRFALVLILVLNFIRV